MEIRGASHVEIILSSIVFIMAIGFALYFFSPGDSTRLVDSSLTYGFREIRQNVSVEMDVFSVDVELASVPAGVDVVGVDVLGVEGERKSRVEDKDGNFVKSERDGDVVYFEIDSGESFYTIKLSEEFVEEVPAGVREFNEDYYKISSSGNLEVVSERRFLELVNFYDSEYLLLKKYFNLPNRVNMGFSLDGASERAEREIPEGLEVFSDRKRVEILRENGRSEFGELSVWVW